MARKMELIHIVGSVTWGGPERYALDICRHFSARGWKVTAFTRDAKAVDNNFREAGIRLRHAPLNGLTDVPSVVVMMRMMRRMPPDGGIIHVGRFRDAFTALLARKLAGRKDIRVIMTAHNIRKGRDTRLARRIYRNLDALIFVSDLAKTRFLSTWVNAGKPLPSPEERIHILHSSINKDFARADDEPQRGPTVAMFHGPLTPGKGLENIIDALAQLKGIKLRLRIVGSGHPDYVDSLRRRAQARGVMEMIDWRKHIADPHPLIAESHFGVLPSVKEEALGLANIEYMAHGRAQICCGRGAQQEYLADGREALVVAPGDTQMLADAMRTLTLEKELRRHMGLTAFETFTTRLSWPRFISRLEKIYLPEQS